MQTVTVQTSPPYPVHIGPGLLERAGELIAGVTGSRTCAVITDTTVEKLYAAAVCRSLQEAGFQVCLRAFPAGERHKNLTTYAGILEFFAQSRLTRSDLVLALGGGVTGDMAGFAAATLLRGKHKPEYTPHADCGDNVIVINASKATLSGKKLEQKMYRTHSGWVGGLKETKYKDMMEKKPELAMRVAVRGMMPRNVVTKDSLKRLHIYAGDTHEHQAQKPELYAAE